MGVTPEFACPVIVRLYAHDLASEELIDARAHDVHSAGYVLLFCLTKVGFFSADASAGNGAEAVWASVAEKQMSWVSSEASPLRCQLCCGNGTPSFLKLCLVCI